ncbi:MAG: mechanosensitive ion channel domain-containing protein [Pseudomonadota bacterium]
MMPALENLIREFGASAEMAALIAIAVALFGILALAFLAHFVMSRIIVATIERVLKASTSERDDILVRRRVFSRLSHIAPAVVIFLLAPIALAKLPVASEIVVVLSLIYVIASCVLFLDSAINAGLEIYSTYRISRDFPVTSFAQVAKLIIYFVGFITTLSLILGESPLKFIAGLGAMTAVLMLVFKDPILGLVAGIQLSANRMVAVGDWIEMPKYGVDGDVMEIALTTVKIRNFDKTITTVPTQALIADSFKNWRGMQETGGRRIKRSIYVDIGSIRFCDEDMLERFSKIQYIAAYLEEKRAELAEHNDAAKVDNASLVNGRRLTNVGTFRAYISAYLREHPKISKSLTFLVRQLQPTERGLPLEIYVFSLETNWIAYEGIQADIFDHILAAAKEFDLHIFQDPTGADMRAIGVPAAAKAGALHTATAQ